MNSGLRTPKRQKFIKKTSGLHLKLISYKQYLEIVSLARVLFLLHLPMGGEKVGFEWVFFFFSPPKRKRKRRDLATQE